MCIMVMRKTRETPSRYTSSFDPKFVVNVLVKGMGTTHGCISTNKMVPDMGFEPIRQKLDIGF